jgi:hypothetical protein
MTNDELTAEVNALTHRLIELWGWEELGRIGWNLNIALDAMEPGNSEVEQAIKDLTLDVESHLAKCYSRAIEDIGQTLTGLPPGPVLTALLDRLQKRLRLIGENSFGIYLGDVWQPEEYHFDNAAGTRPQAQIEQAYKEHQMFTRDAWACVEKDLGDYLRRVADYIATATGKPTQIASKDERIVWNGSGAELAYLFQSLHAKDWINLPTHNGSPNFTAMARILYSVFDIRDGDEPVKLTSFIQSCKVSGDNAERKDNRNWIFQIKPRQS